MAPDTGSSIVRKAPFEVPACEFYERSTLFHGGDMVHIILGPSKGETGNVKRMVSRAVLSYCSKVCERKLGLFGKISDTDANGQNHNNAILELNEWNTETFDMALQWINPVVYSIFQDCQGIGTRGLLLECGKNFTAELSAASEKEYDEDEKSPIINPTFEEILKDAFAHPIDARVRELLASFLLKPYVKHLLCSDTSKTKAKVFKKLFAEVEGLELDVLRLVGESLSSLSMGKVDGDGYSTSTMWCPLTELRFDTGTMYEVK
ncbi:hypothetical protein H4I96_00782 [Botrytis cinerea]